VAIARALANDPPILIADEMTGDLDSETGFAIMRLAKELNEEGMTIVFVTHDPRMAAFASRLIQIRDGQILDGYGQSNLSLEETAKSEPPAPEEPVQA
jgi:putative ABC transport system ATP-binding protein